MQSGSEKYFGRKLLFLGTYDVFNMDAKDQGVKKAWIFLGRLRLAATDHGREIQHGGFNIADVKLQKTEHFIIKLD